MTAMIGRAIPGLAAERDRRAAITWAAAVTRDPRSLVLDTETLGLDADSGVCDVGIVAMDGTVIADWLIDPGRPIPTEATAVHGITDAMVAGAPTFPEIWPEVRAVLTGRRILVYNARYDLAMLQGCCEAAGIVDVLLTELGAWECAMERYAAFYGERHRRRPGYAWHRLTTAAGHLGIEVNGAHRALADCLTTLAVVRAMAESEP